MSLSNEDLIKLRAEGNKLLHDTMKQLITISSGSILVMITFLEKLFKNPQCNILVAVAFGGFWICNIASLIMMNAISLKMGAAYADEAVKKYQKRENWALPTAAVAFLLAIGALVVFVILNLHLK
jgi:uncharacterized membrane protein YidH (DUF202 family)